MDGKRSLGLWVRMTCALVVGLLAGLATPAQRVKSAGSSLDDLSFARPELRTFAQHEELGLVRARLAADHELAGSAPLFQAVDDFLGGEGREWAVTLDWATGRPALLEGAGIAWVPGPANRMTARPLGLSPATLGRDVPLDVVAERALALLRRYPDLFGVDPADLVLNRRASGPVGEQLYFLEFGLAHSGLPVERARIVFRMNHGNLVQFGQEFVSPALAEVATTPALGPETAWQILDGYLGGRQPGDVVLEPGRLTLVPVMTAAASSGIVVRPGEGLAYRLVYRLAFRRPGVLGTWEARVDALTGEVLQFGDINEYGSVHGGVYVGDRPSAEVDRPFPDADVGSGAYADAGGRFAGTAATSTLSGRYVSIEDTCGPIALTTSTGDLAFGTSTGNDCTTPGAGGAGNTHAARTQYYNVSLIKQKARTYLPANTWVTSTLVDNVNLNQVCNAYFQPLDGSLNFFRSGGGCDNTGELPGVSLHEFAHALDANDGNGSSPDHGTGETYGDFTAVLQTHSSCTGNGFFANGAQCGGYGDACTACSGVRDIDYAKHASHTPVAPTMLGGSAGYRCDLNAGYAGPCGYEGHCESYISSEALWDLATRDLPAAGLDTATAWQLVDRLWYQSRPTAGSAYACPTTATTDGCGVGSLYQVFRVADDADGNLANGTPHGAALYAAFSRHAIACSTGNNGDQPGACPALAQPAVTATPHSEAVALSWPAVPGADHYLVYRNESGCDAGFTKVGSTTGLSFSDATPVNNLTYFYRVQASGVSDACAGPMSACATATPLNCRGSFALDQPLYGCADTLAITLEDVDLAGHGTQSVQAFSPLDPVGETVTLTEVAGAPGRFTGSVSTGAAVVAGDGVVGVQHGSTLTLRYSDADSCGTGPATVDKTVAVDCVGPVLSDLQVTVTDIAATVTWTTDKPSTSRVTWGASAPPAAVVEDLANYTTAHSLTVSGLSPCTTYFLSVTSVDYAGNATTDNGAGTFRPFLSKGLSYLLRDNAENGTGVWTVQNTQGSAWHLDTCRSHSSSHAWKVGAPQGTCPGTYAPNTLAYLVSPTINLGSAGHGYRLRFWDRGVTEVNGYGQVMDWCHVQISTDGGTTYADVIPAFGGDSQGWQFNDLDLAAYTGSVKLRFFFESDWGWEYEGWYVDDIEVSRVVTCAPDLKYSGNAAVDFCSAGGAGNGNGAVEAGEDAVLAVTLVNQGPAAATGAVGTLSTTTPGVTVTRATTAFDAVPALGTGASQAPGFAFRVDGSVACGTAIAFNLHVTSNESAAGWDVPFPFTTGSQSMGAPSTLLNENFNTWGSAGWPTGWVRTPTSGTGQYWRVSSYQVYNCDGNTSNLNMQVDSSSSNSANAWAFTTPLSLQAGGTCTLTFKQRTGGCGTIGDTGSALEVKLGTAQSSASMTTLLQNWTGLTNTTCETRTITFTAPATGTYYLGFHFTRTAPSSYCGINVDDVLFTQSVLVCSQTSCSPSSALHANTAAGTPYAVRPYTVAFTGLATGGTAPYGYGWTFGDGGTSTLQSPGHTYTAAGTYTAALTVTDAAAGSHTDSHLSVRIVDPLAAVAGGSPLSGAAPLGVSFTATPAGGDGTYTYDWDYGDGTAHGTAQNPSHTYSACGAYTVTLRVTDGHGAATTDSHLVVAAGGTLAASSASACAVGAVPVNLSFTGNASCGTPPYTYSWNFGDGSPLSSQQNPLHAYALAGNYSAVLTVKDSLNNTATATAIPVAVSGGGGTVSETFDSATPPALPAATWTSTPVTGTSNWITNAGTHHPSGGAAYSSPNIAVFDCYNITSGNSARLKYNTAIPLGNATARTLQLSFYMFHDTGFTTYQDSVQVQYSTDGTTWNSVGSAVYRYDGSSGWKLHTVDLSGICAASAYVGLLATSKYGNDVQVDNIAIVNQAKPATVVYDSVLAVDACATGGAGNGDGAVDPGETSQVIVTLRNTGAQASTGVSGTLTTSASGVTVTSGTSAFGDLASYQSTATPTTPFAVSLDASVPCGASLPFSLAVTSAQGSWPLTFNLPAGGTSSSTLLAESFDGAFSPPLLPSGWAKTVVQTGTPVPDWTTTASPSSPGASPYTSPRAATFNSATTTAGGKGRLYSTSSLNLSAYGSTDVVTLSFWMYHPAGSQADSLQPQVSTDGGATWNNVGSAVSAGAGSAGWQLHTADLAAYRGQAAVLVGFLATSAKTANLHLDQVGLTVVRPACNACAPALPPAEVAPGATLSEAQRWSDKNNHLWSVGGAATGYKLYRGTAADLPGLAGSGPDGCLRSQGAAPSANLPEDPTGVPGGFYWYLVTGTNAFGEGTAGAGRVVNATGPCT